MPQKLTVADFTTAVEPLNSFLDKTFTEPIYVSDVRDELDRQIVDLVQEGGGVHGIALAGYTYILEKKGIAFMKMAGTSAGSINTLLLNAVYTKKEAVRLGVKDDDYYETRSEKVLEYLSDKDLADLVDGHPLWRKLILGIFTPGKKENGFTKHFKAVKFSAKLAGIFLAVLIVTSLFLSLYTAPVLLRQVGKWTAIVSCVGLILCIAVIFSKMILARLLYKHAEKFGINPGKDFEQWITEKILEKNGIHSVEDLQNKFQKEQDTFKPRYQWKPVAKPAADESETKALAPSLDDSLQKITNPYNKVETFLDDLAALLIPDEEAKKMEDAKIMDQVMAAFQERLGLEDKRVEDNGKNPVTKEMVIVSSDITHGLKVEFPGMHRMYWGDDYSISPAKYVRASMAVPIFFKPFQVDFNKAQATAIQEEWHKMLGVPKSIENCALMVDGGMLSNFPINVFYNPGMPVPRKPTFGIKLEYEDETMSHDIRTLLQFGGSIINTMRFFYDRDFALKHDIYQKTVRSIDTGKIHWLNFNLSDQDKIELFYRGALAATIFLARHKITAGETQHLMEMGKSVAFKGGTMSIYPDGEVNFKTEDSMIGNITFEWEKYKKERLFDRVSKDHRKDELKKGAALYVNQNKDKNGK